MRTNIRPLHPRVWSHRFRVLKKVDYRTVGDRQPRTEDYAQHPTEWDGMLSNEPLAVVSEVFGRVIENVNRLITQPPEDCTVLPLPNDRVRFTYPADMSGLDYTVVEQAEANQMYSDYAIVKELV